MELFEGKRPPDKFFADALRAGESVGGLKRLASTTRKALGESARFVTDMDRLREVAEEIWEFLS